MKNKKGQLPLVAIGAIILIALFVFLFVQSQKRVIFGIQLQDQKIIENTDTILFYTIRNNLGNEIEEVRITYQIINVRNSERIEEIETIGVKMVESGAFNVNARNLDSGDYVVRADLSYYDSKKMETKSFTLTLNFEIVEAPSQ